MFYNEKNNIQEIIEAVIDSPVPNKEIIVVYDFSTDGTREILQQQIEPLEKETGGGSLFLF